MDKEQIKAISESIPMEQRFSVEQIVSAAIESYKAELRKEGGEPTCWMTPDGEGWRMRTKPPETDTKLGWMEFYTFDQVAAAILKATKPLEEEVARLQDEDNLPVRYYQPNGKGPVYAVYGSSSIDFVEKLRNQLTAAQEEISGLLTQLREMTEYANKRNDQALDLQDQLAKANQLWQVAQGRCDGLEEKLAKAEQRVAEYNELIYAVQTKNPDETRHQTALRYIRNAENRPSNTAANGASS